MQVALGVVHVVALAQGVEVVALPRVLAAGHDQGIHHGAQLADGRAGGFLALQLRFQETQVERCVVDDQLRAANKLDEIRGDVLEQGLVGEEFIGDAVYFYGALVDFPPGVDVLVEMVAGKTAVFQLHTAYFDDTVPLGDFQAGGFGIQHDLPHARAPSPTRAPNSSMPRLANWSASSFSR